jgi:mannonate dehydratase
MKLRRRTLLIGGGAALGAVAIAGSCSWPRIARPARPDGPLSAAAAAAIADSWTGLDPARVIDCHVHVVGIGASGSGCWVNPRMMSWLHPLQRARFDIYRRAAGIDDLDDADRRYAEGLYRLASAVPHGKYHLLAFDRVYREDGTADDDASEFFVPNDWALKLAAEHPELFAVCGSVHPYRKDAIVELERVAKRGARCIKWLPNAMRIDPSSPKCTDFYRKLAELRMPLLTHVGEEKAVEAEEAQRLANPLRMRAALDAGVKVIMAHCASLGEGEDLDAPGDPKPRVANFELFMRMMDDGRYKDRLFGEISATTQFNRCAVVPRLLARTDLHARMVNGSDYPLPAINALLRTRKLVSLGVLTEQQRAVANEIDRHNPLLLDVVLKRMLRGSGGERFADTVFMPPKELFPA